MRAAGRGVVLYQRLIVHKQAGDSFFRRSTAGFRHLLSQGLQT